MRVEIDGRAAFRKEIAGAPPGMFEVEAAGLEALRATGADVSVPEVLSVGPTHIEMEWIDVGRSTPASAAQLGRGLAAIHRTTSPTYGFPRDGWIGSLPQANPQLPAAVGAARWFADHRLRPMSGPHLPSSLRDRIERVCADIEDHLPVADERPALIHGDLWGGNWLTDRAGRPWLFDPAAHYGCREADLAFTLLFGGFPSAFHDAYEEAHPAPGWRSRADLWNVYHQLTHARMFGGGYAAAAERALRRRVG